MSHHRNSQSARQATSYVDMRRRLRPLLKNKRLGLPAFEAYCEVWELAGLAPGKLTIAGVELAGLIGRDVRRIRDWVEAWARFGIVELIAFDAPTNTYHFYINEPERAFAPHVVHAPPQGEMFSEPAQTAPAESPRNRGETAAEVPRTEASAESRRNRGQEPAQKSLFGEDRGETAAEPPTMDGNHESAAIGCRSSFAAAAANEDLNKSKLKAIGGPTETSRAAAMSDVAAASWEAVAAEINRKRDELHGVKPPDPDDPAELHAAAKERIVEEFLAWADQFTLPGDTKRMTRERAGQVADHILNDGLPEGRLWRLCEGVVSDWHDDRKLRNPLGVFDFRLEALLAELEIPTRAKSKRKPK